MRKCRCLVSQVPKAEKSARSRTTHACRGGNGGARLARAPAALRTAADLLQTGLVISWRLC